MALSKRSKLILVLLSPILTGLFVLLILYRLPVGIPKTVEAEIRYQMVDFGFDDYFRYNFEWIIGNKRIYLRNADVPYLYVSGDDYDKLWPNSPFQMNATTIAGKFIFRKLLCGGYTIAAVADTIILHKQPYITK